MKYIEIYLASNTADLVSERLEIGNYIRVLNDILENRDIKIELITSEEEMREKIDDSDYFIIMFYQDADKLMVEEFELAYNHFKNDKHPNIFTYFKQCDNPQNEVKDFMQRLDSQLSHYYTIFDHIDTVKLKILLSLSAKLDMRNEISYQDAKVLIDNNVVDNLDLSHIPAYFNCDNLKKLKSQLKALDEELVKTKLAFINDPDNKTNEEKYFNANAQRHQLIDEIHQFENDLYQVSSSLTDISDNSELLNAKTREAIKLLNEGKFELVIKLLDASELKNNADSLKKRLDNIKEQTKKEFEVLINECKLEISAYTMQGLDETNIEKIISLYEEIKTYVLEYEISYKALCDYARFYRRIGRYLESIDILKLALKHFEGKEDDSSLSECFYILINLIENNGVLANYAEVDKYLKKLEMLVDKHLDYFKAHQYALAELYTVEAKRNLAKYAYNEALEFALKAIKWITQCPKTAYALEIELDNYNVLAYAQFASGNKKVALRHLDNMEKIISKNTYMDELSKAYRNYDIAKTEIIIYSSLEDMTMANKALKLLNESANVIKNEEKIYEYHYDFEPQLFDAYITIMEKDKLDKHDIDKISQIVERVASIPEEELQNNMTYMAILPAIVVPLSNVSNPLMFMKVKKIIERINKLFPAIELIQRLSKLNSKLETKIKGEATSYDKIEKEINEVDEVYAELSRINNSAQIHQIALSLYIDIAEAIENDVAQYQKYRDKVVEIYANHCQKLENDCYELLVLIRYLRNINKNSDDDELRVTNVNLIINIFRDLKRQKEFEKDPTLINEYVKDLERAYCILSDYYCKKDQHLVLSYLLSAIKILLQVDREKYRNRIIELIELYIRKLAGSKVIVLDEYIEFTDLLNRNSKEDLFSEEDVEETLELNFNFIKDLDLNIQSNYNLANKLIVEYSKLDFISDNIQDVLALIEKMAKLEFANKNAALFRVDNILNIYIELIDRCLILALIEDKELNEYYNKIVELDEKYPKKSHLLAANIYRFKANYSTYILEDMLYGFKCANSALYEYLMVNDNRLFFYMLEVYELAEADYKNGKLNIDNEHAILMTNMALAYERHDDISEAINLNKKALGIYKDLSLKNETYLAKVENVEKTLKRLGKLCK